MPNVGDMSTEGQMLNLPFHCWRSRFEKITNNSCLLVKRSKISSLLRDIGNEFDFELGRSETVYTILSAVFEDWGQDAVPTTIFLRTCFQVAVAIITDVDISFSATLVTVSQIGCFINAFKVWFKSLGDKFPDAIHYLWVFQYRLQ